MVASAVYILDVKGKVLISRNYRGDVPVNAVDKFIPLTIENEDDEAAAGPVIQGDGVSYVYVKHNNVYRTPPRQRRRRQTKAAADTGGGRRRGSRVVGGAVLAITRKNSNVAAILVYLHKMKQVSAGRPQATWGSRAGAADAGVCRLLRRRAVRSLRSTSRTSRRRASGTTL